MKQSEIKSLNEFSKMYLEGFEEITDWNQLEDMIGGTIRYKQDHYRPGKKVLTTYRIGGILTHTDHQQRYIRLKNPSAEAMGSKTYGGGRKGASWSVQLRAQQTYNRNQDAVLVPVFTKWQINNEQLHTMINSLQQLGNTNSHGFVIISLWGCKPSGNSRELTMMRSLFERLQNDNHESVKPPTRSAVNNTKHEGSLSTKDQWRAKTPPRPSNIGAIF